MRLSLVAPALTVGLLCGWAALAQADASPPAAPIFYCPTPGKAAPAPAPAKAPAARPAGGHIVHVARHEHHGVGCPTMRVASTHHWNYRGDTPYAEGPPAPPHGPPGPPPPPLGPPHGRYAGGDVSASQAFIYRYERALNGLDARAADEAWAHDGPPPPRRGERPAPPHAYVDQQALPPVGAHYGYVQHMPPMIVQRHVYVEQTPPPPQVERRAYVERTLLPPPPVPAPVRAPRPAPQAYAWQDRSGGSVSIERGERDSGWSYSEENGRGHFEHWGDGDGRGHERMDRYGGGYAAGYGDRHDNDERYEGHHRLPPPPCPPSTVQACGAVLNHTAAQPIYTSAGRDAAGYLVWPGKN
ncbi:MAG TPA: hypothetical protein VGI95_05550 [Caulobacteraceae bacterium]|jgi:hypothetical protein